MEKKKADRVNIDRHRVPVILTGLLFVGGMTLASFTFTDITDVISERNNGDKNSEVVFQLTPKEITPPEVDIQHQVATPPQEDIIVDSNSTDIPDPNIVILDPPDITVITTIVNIDPPIEDFPDREAMFSGGAAALQKWIADNVVYPQTEIELNNQGRVYLSFVVETDGSISNISVERGVSEGLDREAKRVMRKMPKWIPGETNGKRVRTRCRLPIIFELD